MTINEIYTACTRRCQPYKALKFYPKLSIKGDHRVTYTRVCNCMAAAFCVDGALIPRDEQSKKCDFALIAEKNTSENVVCLIEMKSGRNVSRACEQLLTTLSDPMFACSKFSIRESIVVYSSLPSNILLSSEWTQKSRQFSRMNCKLRKVKSGAEDKEPF